MAGIIQEGLPVYIYSLASTGIVTDAIVIEDVGYVVHMFTGEWASCPSWDVEILH